MAKKYKEKILTESAGWTDRGKHPRGFQIFD